MTLVELLLAFAKAGFVVVMLALNLGGLLTWADRRQGAMMQDRIGPNRAVIWLPKRAAQAGALVPAVLLGLGLVVFALLTRDLVGPVRSSRAAIFAHLAVLSVWTAGLGVAGLIRLRGLRSQFDAFVRPICEPRWIFLVGLAGHVLIVIAMWLFRGTDLGWLLRELAFGGGPFVTAFALLFAAGYAAADMDRRDLVGVRLAGLLHPAADGLKSLFKEDFVPPNADRLLHGLAPFISFFPALVLLAVVPFGDTLCFAPSADGKLDFTSLLHPLGYVPRDGVCTAGAVPLQVAQLNVGLLYVFALAGTGIVGAALAGWSSDNKFSLLGGLRAASQMVSYEVTLGLTLVGALMVYGTLRFDEMVAWQAANTWGIFVQPLAFVMFLAAAIAESKRIPFDLPEGESEIVAGYFTEYSGMKFAMFFFSEYVAIVSISALAVTAFLGGWHVPFLERDGLHVAIGEVVLVQQRLSHVVVVGLGTLAFVLKVVALCTFQLAIRWTLPRFRYDQLMNLGWRILLPASLVNVLFTGLLLLAVEAGGLQLLFALGVAGDVTMALVALAVGAGLVWLVLYWLEPVERTPAPETSTVKAARALGGTRTARMGA